MLRIRDCKSVAAAQNYYTAGSQADYYTKDGHIPGIWGGTLAERFELKGDVKQEDFNRLCAGRDPNTGKALLPDKRKTVKKRAGQDWTFSAPKSVTVLREWTGDSRIDAAFREAIAETMADVEREMKTRVRKHWSNGDRATGNMLWSGWTHTTTRPINGVPDPHLHMHVFVMNVTWDATEGRFKAAQCGDLKKDGQLWDAMFESRFSRKLNALGYATERNGETFRVVGMPVAVTDKFSRRTKEINAKIAAEEAKGITLSAKDKDRLGEKTRQKKSKAKKLTKEELTAEWWSWLTPDEKRSLDKVAKGIEPERTVSPQQAMEYAVEHCFVKDSTVSEKRLREVALRYGVGSVKVEDIDPLKMPNVYGRMVDGQMMCTTRDVLNEEMAILKMAREGQGKYPRMADGFYRITKLDAEQREAALHVLRSNDFVIGIRGGAGTGKTTMMRDAIDALRYEQVPMAVQVLSPTGDGRERLEKDGYKDAMTVAMLLKSVNAQQGVAGKLLWVDEAGQMGSKELNGLVSFAKAKGCRLVLSGDYRQHGSVGRGNGFLKVLETEAGVKFAELRKVRRQKVEPYRQAVESIAAGEIKQGFEQLDKAGCIVRSTGRHRHGKLVKEYMEAIEKGENVAVIAPTHREGQRLNAKLREALKAAGKITGDERSFKALSPLDFSDVQKADARNYESGQVVQFTQNVKGFKRGERAAVAVENGKVMAGGRVLPLDEAAQFEVYGAREIHLAVGDTIRATRNGVVNGAKRLETALNISAPRQRVNNGATFKVTGFTQAGDIKLDNGWVLPKDWGHMKGGLVSTSFGAQGRTVDRVLVAMGNESLGAIDRQQWYVSASRARYGIRVFLDKASEAVEHAIEKSAIKMSAVELMKVRSLPRLVIERNRVTKFLKDRATAITKAKEQDRVLAYG
jgi:conjugative relaxase-like TrwC/TraI family protein